VHLARPASGRRQEAHGDGHAARPRRDRSEGLLAPCGAV